LGCVTLLGIGLDKRRKGRMKTVDEELIKLSLKLNNQRLDRGQSIPKGGGM